MRQEKRKKRGEEKAKSKSQDCCVTLKPMLSAHARTSQANILHVDQKAVKCMRGRGEIPDSLFFIQLHSQGLSLPYPRGDRGKTTDSLSYIQPHSKRNENRA